MTYKAALCLLQAYNTLSMFESDSATESQFVEGLQCGIAIMLRNLNSRLDLDDPKNICWFEWSDLKEQIDNM